jgi:hypothetical protein
MFLSIDILERRVPHSSLLDLIFFLYLYDPFLNQIERLIRVRLILILDFHAAECPMTHASIPPETRKSLGIEDGFIRLSVGIEYIEDLVSDLRYALE